MLDRAMAPEADHGNLSRNCFQASFPRNFRRRCLPATLCGVVDLNGDHGLADGGVSGSGRRVVVRLEITCSSGRGLGPCKVGQDPDYKNEEAHESQKSDGVLIHHSTPTFSALSSIFFFPTFTC